MLISPKSPTEISLSFSRVRRYMSNMALVSKKRAIQWALQWNLHEDTAISKFFLRESSLTIVNASSFSAVFENLKLRQTTGLPSFAQQGFKRIREIICPVSTKAQLLTLFGFGRKQVLCLRYWNRHALVSLVQYGFFPSNVLKMSW